MLLCGRMDGCLSFLFFLKFFFILVKKFILFHIFFGHSFSSCIFFRNAFVSSAAAEGRVANGLQEFC